MLYATLHSGFSIDYLVSSKGYELTAKLQSFQVCICIYILLLFLFFY
jgi:hypothetical protein